MTIAASDLEIALEEKQRWRRTMSVTVPARVVTAERRKIAQTLAGRLKLPGFRSGRIPASVVEQRYGAALNREMLDRVIGEAYKEALRSESLNPISEGEVEDIHYEPDQDLRFSITFDVRPEIEIGRVGGFAVQKPAPEVGDEEVQQVLQRLREQNGAWRPVDEGKPEAGDLVSLRVQKLAEGEPEGDPQEYELVLGQGDAIPDVESAIYTLDLNETDDFEATFPDDFPNEARRGEVQHLRISLLGRKVRELPDLDDDFARSVGDFEDLGALEARIRDDLGAEAEEQSEAAVRRQLLQHLADANPFEVPESMVDRYVESVLGDTENVDPERLATAREQIRPEAEQAVKRILIIERVAETQDLRATEEELDERIETIAEKNDTRPAEVYARFQKSGRLEVLEREITESKVFDFLKGQSEIVPQKS
jgi:trigger factor